MTKDETRTQNFLRLLRERYNDSPKVFEVETGYSANMVSQIKTGKKFVGEHRAAKLEKAMKLESGALDRPIAAGPSSPATVQVGRLYWPFSVSITDFEALSPRMQRELDESFTRLVLGAQAQDLLQRQAKKREAGR